MGSKIRKEMIENGSQRGQKSSKNEEKSIPEGSGRRLGVMWGALGGAGRALGMKSRQFPTQTPSVLEPFLLILSSFLCFCSEAVFQHGFGTVFS